MEILLKEDLNYDVTEENNGLMVSLLGLSTDKMTTAAQTTDRETDLGKSEKKKSNLLNCQEKQPF
jgi:hypothetical protein